MHRKKPQSIDSHLYDRRVLSYLKSVLPEHWKYVPVGDEDNQIEYGQDRIVQLTDKDNQIDGAEFRVQNKGTRRKITKRGVSVGIAVSTLNYLRDLPLPVLLHFYHIPTETGYWMWLDDLFSQSNPAEWQKYDKVSICIPTANVMDAKAVEQIEQRVLALCRLQALVKHAHSQTLNDPHYSWDLKFCGNGIVITQEPKHPDAPPMMLDLNISSELRGLLVEAWETGITVRLNGLLPIQGVPDWVKQIFEGEEIEFFRTPPNRVVYNQFRFYKHAGDSDPFYDTGPIEMRFRRLGSKVSQVEGVGPDGITVFGVTVDIRDVQRIGDLFKIGGGVYVIPDQSVTDVVLLDECYSFIENLMSAEKILFYSPLNGMTIPLHFNIDREEPDERRIFRDLVRALAIIQRELDAAMPIPKVFSEAQFRDAEFIISVIQTGRSPFLLLSKNLDSPHPDRLHLLVKIETEDDIQQVLRDISTENEYHTLPGVPEFQVEVLDRQLQLGPTEHVMKLIRCLNADDLRPELTAIDAFGKTFDLFWEVDWEMSYTKFPKFSKD